MRGACNDHILHGAPPKSVFQVFGGTLWETGDGFVMAKGIFAQIRDTQTIHSLCTTHTHKVFLWQGLGRAWNLSIFGRMKAAGPI